jgi:hypothetical protein
MLTPSLDRAQVHRATVGKIKAATGPGSGAVVPGIRSTSGGREKVDDCSQGRLFVRGEQDVADPLELYVLSLRQQR